MKVLLADTNRAAVPIYQALRQAGHQAWVVGRDPGEPLAKICPHFVRMDYADTARLAALVKKHRFGALIPGCTDVSYRACAEVSRGRFPGIDHPQAFDTLQRKDRFRDLAESLGIPVPPTWHLAARQDFSGLMVKPVDSFSGKGMTLLQQPKPRDISAAIRKARQSSATGKFIVEHFVPGQLHSHSAFLRGGRIVADFFVQEDCVAHPFAVDLSRMALKVPNRIKDQLRRDITQLMQALSLQDGLLHAQFILSRGRYWLIEVTRRCPGDLYSLLVEYATGFPYAAAYVAPFLGAQAPRRRRGKNKFIIRHTVSPQNHQAGFWGLRFHRPMEPIHFIPLAKPGDCLPAGPAGRAALMFLATPTRQAQDRQYAELLRGHVYDFV